MHVVLAMYSHDKKQHKKQLQIFHEKLHIWVQSVEMILWVFLEKTGNETQFLGFDCVFKISEDLMNFCKFCRCHYIN